jgi:hypothetical protein
VVVPSWENVLDVVCEENAGGLSHTALFTPDYPANPRLYLSESGAVLPERPEGSYDIAAR